MPKSSNAPTTNDSSSKGVLRVDMNKLEYILDFVIETKLPICIWGHKAVGKTTRIYDVAAEKGYRLEVLHLATQDIVDLIGMMAKVPEDADAKRLNTLFNESQMGKDLSAEELAWVKETMINGKQKTVWTRPQWLHNDDNIPTIYFLDEMNRANKFVSAAMLPFLLEGRMHQHRIGKNDVVIAACNPSTGKYSVNDAFAHDEALKDRCGHVILEPTKDEFMSYAAKFLGSTTLNVLSKHSSFTDIGHFDLPFKVEPSRRSLVNVMQHVDKKSIPWVRKYGKYVIPCYLGTEFLGVWWESKFMRDDFLTIEQLIAIKNNEEKIKDSITALVDGRETVKQDIYEASLDTITEWFHSSYKDGSTNLDWLVKYFSFSCIPKDSIVATMSKVDVLTNPYLVDTLITSKLLDQLPEITKYNQFNQLCESVNPKAKSK